MVHYTYRYNIILFSYVVISFSGIYLNSFLSSSLQYSSTFYGFTQFTQLGIFHLLNGLSSLSPVCKGLHFCTYLAISHVHDLQSLVYTSLPPHTHKHIILLYTLNVLSCLIVIAFLHLCVSGSKISSWLL